MIGGVDKSWNWAGEAWKVCSKSFNIFCGNIESLKTLTKFTKDIACGYWKNNWLNWRQQCKEIRCPKVLGNFCLTTSWHVVWGPGPGRSGMRKVQHTIGPYGWSFNFAAFKSCIAPEVILICWFYSARLVCFVGFVIFVDFLMGVPRTSNQIGGVLFEFSQQLDGLDGGTMLREYKRYILYSIQYTVFIDSKDTVLWLRS